MEKVNSVSCLLLSFKFSPQIVKLGLTVALNYQNHLNYLLVLVRSDL